MKISEVMTPDPACCAADDSAHKAAVIMRELNVGIIPVVDSDENLKLLGVVTDRDLCMKVVAEGKDPNKVTMKDCMSTGLITCTANDDVETVLHLMQQNQVRRIPVIDDQQRIEGIVSTADMVLCGELGSDEIDETMRDIFEPTFEEFEHLAHLGVPGADLGKAKPSGPGASGSAQVSGTPPETTQIQDFNPPINPEANASQFE